MKTLFYSLLFISAMSCGSSAGNQENDTEPTAENISEDNDVLVGKITRDDLLEAPHEIWYDAQYRSYTPKAEPLQIIQDNINDYDIEIYMGTWCADSQLEVPRFFKLLEQSNYDLDRIEMLGVALDKTLPGGLKENYEVGRVPTFIFYKDGKEVNRFVEFPQESLEEDVAKIVSGRDYRNPYAD